MAHHHRNSQGTKMAHTKSYRSQKLPHGEWINPGKRSIGTIMIPPDGSITLQKTLIHNCIETEIEADFMIVDENLVELLITKSK